MASLEEGNWILLGTRWVTTAGTLVAFGLDVSGLLLDLLLDELGSEGGEIPDILTQTRLNFCAQLQRSGLTRALLSVPSNRLQRWAVDSCSTILPLPTKTSQVGYQDNKVQLKLDELKLR